MLGVQNILDYLLARYADHLAKPQKMPSQQILDSVKADPAMRDFLAFATEFLATNRPAAITHEESNYIIQLMDGTRYSVAPPFQAVAGSMQQSPFFPVTGGDTLKDLMQGGMPTTMTPMAPAEDRSQGGPAVRYDR